MCGAHPLAIHGGSLTLAGEELLALIRRATRLHNLRHHGLTRGRRVEMKGLRLREEGALEKQQSGRRVVTVYLKAAPSLGRRSWNTLGLHARRHVIGGRSSPAVGREDWCCLTVACVHIFVLCT